MAHTHLHLLVHQTSGVHFVEDPLLREKISALVGRTYLMYKDFEGLRTLGYELSQSYTDTYPEGYTPVVFGESTLYPPPQVHRVFFTSHQDPTLLSLVKLMGQEVSDLLVSPGDPFEEGVPLLKVLFVVLADGTTIPLQGENALAYIEAQQNIPRLDSQTLIRFIREEEGERKR